MKSIIIFLCITITLASCGILCNLNNIDAYDYVKMINTSELKPSSYLFPSLDEINMVKFGRYYIFNDTMLRLYPDSNQDTLYQHFIFKIGCQFGKPYIEDGSIEQFF